MSLADDQEFQSEIDRIVAKYPGLTEQKIFGIISGESSGDSGVKNPISSASGLFQFTDIAVTDINNNYGTNYTTAGIRRLSPADQVTVYDLYLERANYRGGPLGIVQAAPQKYRSLVDQYGSWEEVPGDTVVYERGSKEYNDNSVWVGADGRMTIDSINAYYESKQSSGANLAGPGIEGSTYSISTRDELMLDFISSKESGAQYTTVYPGDTDPKIVDLTINEILEYQRETAKQSIYNEYNRADAMGRYQLTISQISKASKSIGLDQDLVTFSPDVQDALALELIKIECEYNEWLENEDKESVDVFQLCLSQQFESIPGPCETNGTIEELPRNVNNFSRTGAQTAQYDCNTARDMLLDIKATPEGSIREPLISPFSSSGVTPYQGSNNKRIGEYATAGGSYSAGHAGITQTRVDLPSVDNPYQYESIDPWDDRYDFRLGKKVNDIGINGINPVSKNSIPNENSLGSRPGRQTPPTQGPDDGTRGESPVSTTEVDDVLFQQPVRSSPLPQPRPGQTTGPF